MIGTPKANKLAAWPRPQAAPSRAAAAVARSSAPAIKVVTAARWSGSVACRRPSAVATSATTRSVVPSEKPATQLSRPNTSDHPRQRVPRHRHAGGEDYESTGGREQAQGASVEAEPAEGAAREHCDETDAGDAQSEAHTECEDQGEAEGDSVERDRGQQHNQRRGAGEEP